MDDSNEQDEYQESLKALIFQGQKIAAIKLHREKTGMGLKESKEAVEHLTNQLRLDEPDLFDPKKSGGCGMVLLFGFMSVGALATYLLA